MQSNKAIIFKDRGAKSKANLTTVLFRSDCWAHLEVVVNPIFAGGEDWIEVWID